MVATVALFGLAGVAAGQNPPPRDRAPWDPVAARRLAVEAVGRYNQGEVAAARDGLVQALELRPGNLQFLQYLASAEERLGHGPAAVAALARIHQLGYELPIDPPEEWAAKAAARPEYQQALAATAQLRAPLVRSGEAFRLPSRTLIPEGLAYDPKKGDFYVSSVRERRILRRAADGKVADFVPAGTEGVFSVLGLALDAGRRRLWAATTAYPPMEGYEEKLAGQSALLAFDLDSGKLVGRYAAEKPGKRGFNDVRVAPDGAIFVTDHEGRPGTLFRLDPKTLKIEPFGDPDALGSPEGLTFSPDGKYLFVADYSYGIVRYELATGKHIYLADPPNGSLGGIDHLDWHRGALIAVQNGQRPNAVLRLPLSPDFGRILGVEVLERAHPAYSEPTLGTVVGDDLYYVATSQWNKVDENGRLAPAEELVPAIVLRLPLGGVSTLG